MPSYKLVYFDGKGRGEISRLLFAAAGEKYEDVRIKQEDWSALKPKTPCGSLPYLEVDGQTIAQSNTIARFLARRFKLMGANDLEEAKVNSVLDALLDFRTAFYNNAFEKDETKKAEADKKIKEETLPGILKFITSVIKENKAKGFVVGSSLTLADLAILDFLDPGFGFDISTYDAKFPEVAAVRKNVCCLPRIAEWLKKRPQTFF